jgi:cell division initiation protein
MDSLLRARDIETRILKKAAFGGYSVLEVDEFLDQISEEVELYIKKREELERTLAQLETEQKEYEELKDSIQDTLFAAQRAAKQITLEGQRAAAEKEAEAENLLSEAREKCQQIVLEGEKILKQSQFEKDQMVKEAEDEVREIHDSILQLKKERMQFIESSEKLAEEYINALSSWRESSENY